MVVKTEICSFSELRIYPGKGIRYMSKDCKLPIFLNKKTSKLYLRKVKPQKIRWCTAWRRINKKLQTSEAAKKKKRRAKKIIREIAGLDIEEINKRKTQAKDKDQREAEKEKALREIKQRKANAAKNVKKPTTGGAPQQKAAAKTGKK